MHHCILGLPCGYNLEIARHPRSKRCRPPALHHIKPAYTPNRWKSNNRMHQWERRRCEERSKTQRKVKQHREHKGGWDGCKKTKWHMVESSWGQNIDPSHINLDDETRVGDKWTTWKQAHWKIIWPSGNSAKKFENTLKKHPAMASSSSSAIGLLLRRSKNFTSKQALGIKIWIK